MIPNPAIVEAISRVKGVLSCKQLNWFDFAVETTHGRATITVCPNQDSSVPNLYAGYNHIKGERDKMKPVIERIFRNIKAIITESGGEPK